MKSSVGKPPLDNLDALVAKVNERGVLRLEDCAVSVLHGSERCPDAFTCADEADQVQGSVLAGVGADDALVTFDAKSWNHESSKCVEGKRISNLRLDVRKKALWV